MGDAKRTLLGEDIQTILEQLDNILYIHRKIIELLAPDRIVVDSSRFLSKDEIVKEHSKL